MNLRSRRNTIILISSIVVFIALAIFSFYMVSNFMSNKQVEILNNKRDITIGRINEDISELEGIVESLATFIKMSDDYDNLENILKEVKAQNPVLKQLYFVLPDKTYYFSSDFIAEPDYDGTSRTWYTEALDQETLVYSDAYYDATDDNLVITMSKAVYKDGVLMGVFGADISLTKITNLVKDYIDEEITFAFLLDSNNNVIAHTNHDIDNTNLLAHDVFELPVQSFTEPVGITEYITIGEETGKISYGQIELSNYTYGLFMTKSILNQSYILFVVSLVSILLLASGLFITIFIFYSSYVNLPMKQLIIDIKKIDIKEHQDYRLDVNKQSKFINIRKVLNQLIDESIENHNESIKALNDLSLEVQKFQLLLESSTDLVFMIDTDRRYVEVYGKSLAVAGVTKEEVIGRTHEEVFGNRLSKERLDQYVRALNGEKIYYEWEEEYQGKCYYFQNILSPIYDYQDNIIGAVGISRDVTEKQERFNQMEYISTHDHLTSLYNRRAYYEKMIDLSTKKVFPFTLVNLDVNGLKIINDAYGHKQGDQALKLTAEILKETVPDDCFVFRVSGDEFSILMPKKEEEDAKELKTKLKEKFNQSYIDNINLSVAIGYYTKHDEEMSLDEVRKSAENNMYREKILERKSVKNKAISAILKTLTDKYANEKRHSENVAKYSKFIGIELGLNADELRELETAALFHDIGKISIPDNILRKPGKLTNEEFEIIKTHTIVGYDILHAADEYSDLAVHASSHHERYDGFGYPNGLKGENIPYYSRIITIADAFDAMTSNRLYKDKLSFVDAKRELQEHAGSQFDPAIVTVFTDKVLKDLSK